MYLVGIMARRSRNYEIFHAVRNSPDSRRAGKFISDSLPPIVASVIESNEMEQIRSRLITVAEPNRRLRLTTRDVQKAAAIFLIMVVSTFPVVIPFVFIGDTNIALRVSNLVAIVMMFLCGWSVAGYVGFSKWAMSLAMVLIGTLLVAITILLGG
jgi:VIT1/CCC1 family predicted Fe2+/Mn2+ transporter